MKEMNLDRRVFLYLMKYMPIVFAIGILVNDTFYNMGIPTYYVIHYLVGNSLYTSIMMLLSSYVFKFCAWHRAIIAFNFAALFISALNTYNVINLDVNNEIRCHYSLAVMTVILVTYLHFKAIKTKRKENKQ